MPRGCGAVLPHGQGACFSESILESRLQHMLNSFAPLVSVNSQMNFIVSSFLVPSLSLPNDAFIISRGRAGVTACEREE